MKYSVHNQEVKAIKDVNLNPNIFAVAANEALIHQVVVAQMANKRAPIAHTKDKSEVSGGGRKPWRQKGTGRARHGSNRSPIWVGGGVTFGPTKNRNFSKKINKKMKRKALFMGLSDRAQSKNMALVDKVELKDWKTKDMKLILDKFNQEIFTNKEDKKVGKNSCLIVASKDIANISRSARNIPGIKVLDASSLNIIDILKHKNLLMTADSLEVIAKTYLKN